MAMVKGLDISKHQNTFDAKIAKSQGIGLVACRVAYGTSKDTLWDKFTANINAHGVPLAAYGFLTAHYLSVNGGSLAKARPHMHKQVDLWVQLAKTAGVRWLAVDEENEDLKKGKVLGLNRADNTTLLLEACSRIAAAGIEPRIYCGAAWAMSNIDMSRVPVKMWIAYYYRDPNDPEFLDGVLPGGRYGDFMRKLGSQLTGWQFGRIGYGPKYGAGSNNLDRNYFYDMEDKPMDDYSDTLKIGPVSGGDRKSMRTLAESLALQCNDVGDYLAIGPMSGGDKAQVIAKANGLALGIESYAGEPGPSVKKLILTGLTAPQNMVLKSLALLFGGAATEE